MSKLKQTAFLLMNFLEAVAAGLLFLVMIIVVLIIGPFWFPAALIQKILKKREK